LLEIAIINRFHIAIAEQAERDSLAGDLISSDRDCGRRALAVLNAPFRAGDKSPCHPAADTKDCEPGAAEFGWNGMALFATARIPWIGLGLGVCPVTEDKHEEARK